MGLATIAVALLGLLPAAPAQAEALQVRTPLQVEVSTEAPQLDFERLISAKSTPRPLPEKAGRSLGELQRYFDNLGPSPDAVPVIDRNAHLVGAVHVLPRFAKKDKSGRLRVYVSREEQTRIAELAVAEAERQGLDPVFVLSFIGQESGFWRKARGADGEIGLMQLMPETARTMLKREDPKAKVGPKRLAKLLEDPETNIRLGVTLLRELKDNLEDLARKKKVHINKVIAAGYNAGQYNVQVTLKKHKRTPLSTDHYVKGISEKSSKLRKQIKQTIPSS